MRCGLQRGPRVSAQYRGCARRGGVDLAGGAKQPDEPAGRRTRARRRRCAGEWAGASRQGRADGRGQGAEPGGAGAACGSSKRGRRAGPTASSARVRRARTGRADVGDRASADAHARAAGARGRRRVRPGRRETPAWKYRQRAETVGAGDAVGMPSHGKRADAIQKPRSERGRAASEPCCTGKCQIHLPFHKANLHLPACGTVRGAHFADFVTQLARFRDTATRGPPKRVSPPTGRAWRPGRLPVPRAGLRATPAHARAAGRAPAACRSPRADVPGRRHRQFPAAARRFAERVAAPPRARPAPAGAL